MDHTRRPPGGEAPRAPRVSVAMCTHNGAAHIEAQLRSILSQQPPPYEVVIGDDDSTDGTVAMIEATLASMHEALGAIDTRVSIVRRVPALGVSKNFEATLAACSGDLIALSDQDDEWHEGKLAALVDHVVGDESLLLVHTDARLVDDGGAPLGLTLLDALEVTPSERAGLVSGATGDAFAVLLRRNLVTGATVMLRRELLEAAQPFPSHWIHDEWLAIIAASVGSLRLLDNPMIDYRQHGANQIGARKPTLSDRWSRLREPRADRALRLSQRASELVERLESLGAAGRVSADTIAAARAKRDHEIARAHLPRWQPARLPAIAVAAAQGRYARYSRGAIDIVRDAVQPAGRPSERVSR